MKQVTIRNIRYRRGTLLKAATITTASVLLASCATSGSSGSSGAGGTLNAVFLDTAVYNPCVAKYTQEFTKETGIKVKTVSEGFATFHDKLLTTLSSGSKAYDLAMIAYQWTGEFSPFLVPITDKVKADNADLGGILPASTATYVYNDKQYAIPFTAQAESLFYRTDLFKKAGLTPPKTWADYEKTAAFFTKNPKFPGIYGTSVKGATSHAQTMFDNRYYGLGGAALGVKGSTLNVDAAAAALEQLKTDEEKYSPPGAKTATFAEVSAQFAAGQVAMAELMPTTVLGLVNAKGGNNKVLGKVGVTTVPGGHGEAGGWGLAVTKVSKQQDAAYKYAKFLTTPKADLGCYTDFGKPAVQAATYTDPKVKSAWQTEGVQAAVASSIGKARGETAARINGMMDDTVSRFTAGQAGTARQAAEELAKSYADLAK